MIIPLWWSLFIKFHFDIFMMTDQFELRVKINHKKSPKLNDSLLVVFVLQPK